MSALKKPARYEGEYAYRPSPGLEDPLPDYLEELVLATHDGLASNDDFASVTEIDLGQGEPKYRLVMDLTGVTLTIQFNGEAEDTHRSISMIENYGGIRDILAGFVSGGGLPSSVDPNHIHIHLS